MMKKYKKLIDKMDSIMRIIMMPSFLITFAHMPIIMYMKNKGFEKEMIDMSLISFSIFGGIFIVLLLIMILVMIPYGLIMAYIDTVALIKKHCTKKGRMKAVLNKKKDELDNIDNDINYTKKQISKLDLLIRKKKIYEAEFLKLEKEYNKELTSK